MKTSAAMSSSPLQVALFTYIRDIKGEMVNRMTRTVHIEIRSKLNLAAREELRR